MTFTAPPPGFETWEPPPREKPPHGAGQRKPNGKHGPDDAADAGKRLARPLALIDPRRWTKPAPARAWNVADWIPLGEVTAFYGNGGTGKTTLAQQLLTCAATGRSWLGLETKPGRGLGILCEDDEDELHRRQDAINAHLGVRAEDLGDLRLLSRVGEDNVLMDFSNTDIGQLTAFFHDLEATVADFEPTLLVLDTAADLYGGNENIRPQVRRFIGACLGRLARSYKCGVLLLAHPSQAGLRDKSGTSGTTGWNNSVRSRFYLTQAGDEDNPLPDRRVLSQMKSNYGPADGRVELVWRNGVFVPAGSTCGMDDPATWPAIHAMFDEIERAWTRGNPWSPAPQTRESGRYFPSWARQNLSIPEKRTKGLLNEWMMSGCLANDEVDANAKKRGLRVVRRPDQ